MIKSIPLYKDYPSPLAPGIYTGIDDNKVRPYDRGYNTQGYYQP